MTTPNPNKKRSAWYVVLGLIVGFGFGAREYLDRPAQQAATIQTAVDDDKAVNARARLLQQQLAQIMGRPTSTIDDYIANMRAASPAVEEAKGLVRLQMASVARKRQQHPEGSPDATAFEYAQRLLGKDEELIYLMSDEVHCGAALESMPGNARVAYYRTNVMPIEDKERQVLNEWSNIAKEGQEKGVEWPASVKQFSQ